MLIHHKVTAPAFHQASLTIRRTHLGGERDTVKVNHFTQEHNRMTQLGLEPRPPRPGVHCTNHYATATRGPLPHSPPRLCNILMTPKSIFFIPLLGLVGNN